MIPVAANAQSPIDAYQISQPDLKGTARFMSMGGAFGALGADLSSLSQNPAGIGVYRSNEIGFTLDLDLQSSSSEYMGSKNSKHNTKFYLNNIGGVATMRLNNKTLPNLNFGFTYNKGASFNRAYRGDVPSLKTSLSNYIASIANSYGLTADALGSTDNYDPYIDSDVPWATILGYDSYLISPDGYQGVPNWTGQFGSGDKIVGNDRIPFKTSGSGYFDVRESGSLDEYNIALGGNIANVLYWGMNFDITSLNYNVSALWGENLKDAIVYNPKVDDLQIMDSRWNLSNIYSLSGTGFNYQLGFIVKPIQELRLGFAFHTPTYYNLTEKYLPSEVNYNYPFMDSPDYAVTNDDVSTYNKVNFQTPWKIIVSAAGVIGTKAIISVDYEWNGTRNMKYSQSNSWDWGYDGPDYDWDWGYDYYSSSVPTPEEDANSVIDVVYRNTNTIRVGAEYRILPELSLRAGYNWTSSPVTKSAKDGQDNIPSNGARSFYRLDNSTQYVTAGLGFHKNGWYLDAAYVWKHMTSNYYPFAPNPRDVAAEMINPKLTFNNSQIVLSAGYRF